MDKKTDVNNKLLKTVGIIVQLSRHYVARKTFILKLSRTLDKTKRNQYLITNHPKIIVRCDNFRMLHG